MTGSTDAFEVWAPDTVHPAGGAYMPTGRRFVNDGATSGSYGGNVNIGGCSGTLAQLQGLPLLSRAAADFFPVCFVAFNWMT